MARAAAIYIALQASMLFIIIIVSAAPEANTVQVQTQQVAHLVVQAIIPRMVQ